MKKLYTRFTKLVFRFDEEIEDCGIEKHPYHLNYESGVYREDDLVKIIRGAMPHFALTPEEYNRLKDQDDIDEMYRLAFSRISKAKKDKKGDYGELLLFLLLQTFYKAERLVTKVKLRSSVKDQIKGFDCAHFTVDDAGDVFLWLGEVKFYKSFSGALDDVAKEIVAHTQGEYLKNEFSILCPNVEFNNNVDIPDSVIEILDGTVTLDDVKVVIPALVTYETSVLKAHTCIDQNFKEKIKRQFAKKYELINSRNISIPSNIEVFFLLLPLSDVDSIKSKLEKIEAIYQ
ncbi:protein of unknown function [Pseudomonas sp. NFPP10]|uniref:HamA C-terminal domain-containing protein n=1 Tax=unclassified Pseudomonas TaxID=196821 RepID=UPI000881B0D9|nr:MULTISPECIES: DUF1837 domain-containing protein [unclassified Pseudomonas]SDA25282.1 protein of unknown function [Pseudomonas sp. NFPP12]SEL75751.1 protein of unknown function [Pseudomonas sp. NFPP10]SFJ52315.1 protein of unknown function [Pseudomonas sp. NFPP08]SFM90677.1 protein of unknown function [Pseudomonas sp. NFPP05]SFX64156.1 protein of unknown function [Pseudomonas sp. NFPP09]